MQRLCGQNYLHILGLLLLWGDRQAGLGNWLCLYFSFPSIALQTLTGPEGFL